MRSCWIGLYNRARVFASSWCCAAAIVSPSRVCACTSDRESRSPKLSSLWSYTGRGWIRFLGSALHATAPNLHNRLSSIQVRRHYVLTYSSSATLSTSSTAYQWLRATISNISTTSNDISLYKQKVHTHDLICYYHMSVVLWRTKNGDQRGLNGSHKFLSKYLVVVPSSPPRIRHNNHSQI
jgi:hypothetical protein